jgi:hypothetical protein
MLKTLIFVLLAFPVLLFSQSKQHTPIQISAIEGYMHYLDRIPEGMEKEFGFRSRDEFDRVIIGKAYRVITLSGINYEQISESNPVLQPLDEWRVMLWADDKPRALLTVALIDNMLRAVGIGSSELATEIGTFELSKPGIYEEGILFRLYRSGSDFLVLNPTEPESVWKFVPMNAARKILSLSMDKSNFTFLEIFEKYKSKISELKD